ncbi:NAD(P)-binding protein [Haloarcula brevis]|uniref:NAD(P)-binding protein n=1 Tax=Haloarcula brevis TaxID=3111453 RepID=UPI00300F23F3
MRVSIVGGGFAGLAAAQLAERATADVQLYDEGSYSGPRRGAWGEMVWDYSKLPVERDVPGYVREATTGIFVGSEGKTTVNVPDGVILNRGELEKHWARTLDRTEIVENAAVNEAAFRQLAAESDLLVDATGQFPISQQFTDLSYDVACPTLSGRIEADFSHLYPEPRALAYENYFLWIVPQSPEEATVGLGCRADRSADELYADMRTLLTEIDVEPPERGTLYSGTDVSNGLRSLADCSYELNGCTVHVAGDAIGVANRLTGFGMIHAAQSGRAAVGAFFGAESYRRRLLCQNFWPKAVTGALAPVHDTIGLEGIARLATSDIEYQESFEPQGPSDIVSAVRAFL